MTKFTVGQRVRSIRTVAERNEYAEGHKRLLKELVDLGSISQEGADADNRVFPNAPAVGDVGTVTEDMKGGCLRVEWDREIGEPTGCRKSSHEWFVPVEEIELIEEQSAA